MFLGCIRQHLNKIKFLNTQLRCIWSNGGRGVGGGGGVGVEYVISKCQPQIK